MKRLPNGLIPDHALARMPEPVKAAQARAIETVEILAKAEARANQAKADAAAAPAADAERLAEAARTGGKAPKAQALDLEREAQAAAAAVALLRKDREAALVALHRTLVEHLPASVAAQNDAVTALREEAAAPLAKLDSVLAELEREAGVLTVLKGADGFVDNSIRGTRRLAREGNLNFSRVRRLQVNAPALIEELSGAVDLLGATATETASAAQERELEQAEVVAENRRQQRAMVTGIYVGRH